MSSPDSPPADLPPPASQRSLGVWLRDMPRWKKITVAVALVSVVAGGVLSLVSGDPQPIANPGDTASGLSASLIEGQPGVGSGANEASGEEPASKGFFRLGFSFIAGFAIGAFLRATLKIAAIAFGFWLVMTMGLSYIGIVNVDWVAMQSLYDRFASNVGEEWGSFQSFMLGSLPATGLAVTGLAVGLKRH